MFVVCYVLWVLCVVCYVGDAFFGVVVSVQYMSSGALNAHSHDTIAATSLLGAKGVARDI